jgi:N-acetylmuramoyl-L-alanine amidase
VLVQDYTSTNHPTAPFQKILSWWSGVAREQQIPLYISHSASTIGSYKVGWKLTDQLAQQYLYCKSESAWQGSAYDTLSALKTDKSGIAETLKKAYAGTLDEAFIYKTLTVTSPQKTSYTTTSSTVKFEGGGDTNFPLLINGKEVELTEHGFFTETYTLSIGVNTFEFSHKGITRKYTVTYKQTLLESVSPSQNMDVDGGNPFIISAVAREGSTVKATLGKQTITLSAVPNKDDENTGEESDFQTYSGSLTLLKGTVGADQALGAVSVTATYNGLSETVKGGKITVNGLPVPATTTTVTSPTGGVIPVPDDKGNYEIVVITADYAETFNGGKYTDDYSRPYNSYLPQGTWDYLAGKVYNGSFSYYLLSSGKRVYMKDAKVITAGELKQQELKNGSAAVNGSHTVFTFESAWRVPVYVEAAPQKYYRDSGTPHYGIENYGQTAEYVDVTFHHVTAVPAAPDLSDNPLFSKAEWKAVNANTYTLRLTLHKKGGFYGFSPVWSGDGTLTLSFLNPVDISKNSGEEKLKGIRILIDPGHGSPDDKPWEAPFNLDYANTLKEKLEALGATVEMTRTGPLTTELSLPARTQMAHNKQYHMFISVHMNGANGKATGATVWYYHEYAYTASKYIYDKMHAAETPYGVGTSANGTPRSSGTNWGTLYLNRTIHDCPAVLLECAFLDNPRYKECLIDPIYRDKLMQAVTDGVVAYFSSQA